MAGGRQRGNISTCHLKKKSPPELEKPKENIGQDRIAAEDMRIEIRSSGQPAVYLVTMNCVDKTVHT